MREGKVLAFSPTADFSGAERVLLDLATHLAAHGWRMTVVLPRDGTFASRLCAKGVRTTLLESPRSTGSRMAFLVRSLAWARQLARVAQAEKADLIHANNHISALAGGLASRLSKVPAVLHLHGLPSTFLGSVFWKPLVKALFPNRRCVAVSQYVLRGWFGQTIGACGLVYNGVDLSIFRWREPSSQQFADPGPLKGEEGGGVPIILNVGQLSPHKGQHILLEALALLDKWGYRLRVAFAGTVISSGVGTSSASLRYISHLKALCQTLDLERQVDFLGEVEDVPGLLRKVTVLAHTAYEEPLGMVLLEAMAVGVPVVAPKAGGIPEVIDHMDTGLLYTAGNAYDLASMLAVVLEDRVLASKLAVSARQHIEAMFSADHMAGSMAQVYNSVLSS